MAAADPAVAVGTFCQELKLFQKMDSR
jgi:hypothetical protein